MAIENFSKHMILVFFRFNIAHFGKLNFFRQKYFYIFGESTWTMYRKKSGEFP